MKVYHGFKNSKRAKSETNIVGFRLQTICRTNTRRLGFVFFHFLESFFRIFDFLHIIVHNIAVSI